MPALASGAGGGAGRNDQRVNAGFKRPVASRTAVRGGERAAKGSEMQRKQSERAAKGSERSVKGDVPCTRGFLRAQRRSCRQGSFRQGPGTFQHCQNTDTHSRSLLERLLKREGGAAERPNRQWLAWTVISTWNSSATRCTGRRKAGS